MNKSHLFFPFFLFFISSNSFCQFNTIIQREKKNTMEPAVVTNTNKIINEVTDKVDTNINIKSEHPAIPVDLETLLINSEKDKNPTYELYKNRIYLSLPIDTIIITSKFGMRTHPITKKYSKHEGVDLLANNDYVYSIAPGIVTKTGNNKTLGNYIFIQHGDYRAIYGHLQTILVSPNQTVNAGQILGISGNTGMSTGEHLHFALEHKGEKIDPLPVLNYIKEIMDIAKKEMEKIIIEQLSNK